MAAEKIRLSQHFDLFPDDAQFLPGLPQSADFRRFAGFLHAAGKADFPRLAAESGSPDLKEQVQTVGLFQKRTQNRVTVLGFQHLGNIAVKPAAQVFQFTHSSILKAP